MSSVNNRWVVSTIDEIFRSVGGGTPSTNQPQFWGNGTPWITSADIDAHGVIIPRKEITLAGLAGSTANKVPPGSVIVVTRVGLGKVAIARTALCFSQDCQGLLVEPELVDPAYAAHQVRFSIRGIRGRGTTISGITVKQLQELQFSLPPREEQTRIAEAIESYLSRLDAAAAGLERVQTKLKAYRASALKAAVEGRLVPTEAELARAKQRNYEHADALLKRVLAERRRRWEEAELAKMKAAGKAPKDNKWKAKYQEPAAPDTKALPQLPEGWCWAKASAFYWDANYGTSVKCREDAHGPPVLRIPNVVAGSLSFEDLKFSTDESVPAANASIEPGDFLFIRTNGSKSLIGRGALVRERTKQPVLFASYLIRLRIVDPLLAEWVALAWHSHFVRRQIDVVAASSAGQHNVSLSSAAEFVIPIPPSSEQRRVLAKVSELASVADNTQQDVAASVSRCKRLRQSILKWAFEGKLVDQDPNDEPAEKLLERIRAERVARGPANKTARRRKTKAAK